MSRHYLIKNSLYSSLAKEESFLLEFLRDIFLVFFIHSFMSPNFSILYSTSIPTIFWLLFSDLPSSSEFTSISTLSCHLTYYLIHSVTLFFAARRSITSLLKVFVYFFFFSCCLTFSLNPFIYVFSYINYNYFLFSFRSFVSLSLLFIFAS